eukprot:scaffold740_cov405-Prasinococcus_capsulatus_cf.AAC.12
MREIELGQRSCISNKVEQLRLDEEVRVAQVVSVAVEQGLHAPGGHVGRQWPHGAADTRAGAAEAREGRTDALQIGTVGRRQRGHVVVVTAR